MERFTLIINVEVLEFFGLPKQIDGTPQAISISCHPNALEIEYAIGSAVGQIWLTFTHCTVEIPAKRTNSRAEKNPQV